MTGRLDLLVAWYACSLLGLGLWCRHEYCCLTACQLFWHVLGGPCCVVGFLAYELIENAHRVCVIVWKKKR